MLKKNTIRFYRKYGFTPWQLAGKDFEIESFSTDQGMFDRRTGEVRLTVDANLFKLFNGLSSDIEARVTLSDGTVYVLSELCQMSQMPIYDFYADVYDKPGEKFNTKLTFGNWQVYLPHKDEICSTDNTEVHYYPFKVRYDYRPIHYMFESDFDKITHINLQDEVFKQAVEKLRDELDKELCKSIGIDLGKDKDHTATAIVEEEKRNSLKYAYMKYCNDNRYNLDTLFKDLNKDNNLEIKTEKEKDNMKINNKELKQIIIDEDRKTVTVITETQDNLRPLFGLEPKPTKHVTYSKASAEDEFDKYVGVALALAYQKFGSKEEFHKFVRESELINDVKKNKEAKAAAKEAKKKEAQEAHEKAVARRAKQAEKDEETATELLEKLSKFLNKSKKTKKTKKGE